MSISIPLETFKSIYNGGNFVVSQEIIDKAFAVKQLMNNEIVYRPPTAEKQYTKHISAFNCHLTPEDKKKKIFTSLLNKLSPKNIDVISNKIKNEISEPYDNDINIVISFVSKDRSNIEMYISILNLFPNDIVCNILKDKCVLNKQYWIIKDEYKNKNVYSSTCEYDLYCSFIKWKECQLTITELAVYFLSPENTKAIANSIYNYIEDYLSTCKEELVVPSRDILDPSLEHLEILYKHLLDINLEAFADIDGLPSSSRFKIIDIKNKMLS